MPPGCGTPGQNTRRAGTSPRGGCGSAAGLAGRFSGTWPTRVGPYRGRRSVWRRGQFLCRMPRRRGGRHWRSAFRLAYPFAALSDERCAAHCGPRVIPRREGEYEAERTNLPAIGFAMVEALEPARQLRRGSCVAAERGGSKAGQVIKPDQLGAPSQRGFNEADTRHHVTSGQHLYRGGSPRVWANWLGHWQRCKARRGAQGPGQMPCTVLPYPNRLS